MLKHYKAYTSNNIFCWSTHKSSHTIEVFRVMSVSSYSLISSRYFNLVNPALVTSSDRFEPFFYFYKPQKEVN